MIKVLIRRKSLLKYYGQGNLKNESVDLDDLPSAGRFQRNEESGLPEIKEYLKHIAKLGAQAG